MSVSPRLVGSHATRFMEETDMCHPIPAFFAVQQAIPNGCPAKALPTDQRLHIGLQALAGTQTVTDLADEFDVSRKFVGQQRDRADRALDDAFAPQAAQDRVLFHLPVTKHWLRQFTLGLVLICHSSLRGTVEILRDLFDYPMSVGTAFNIVQEAVAPARQHNQAQDLSGIRVGAHDEIFQARRPVLVGVDPLSAYCYLASPESHRDADTWGVRLLELQERGFNPDHVIADAGSGLRAGQAAALPGVPCHSDVFHAEYETGAVVARLESRAYEAMAACAALEVKAARYRRRCGRPDPSGVQRRTLAAKRQAQALQLADDVALLARWLRGDVLSLAGPAHAERLALYDFIVAELQARVPQAPALLGPLVTYLVGQRDDLLAFAAQLDRELAALAARWAVAPELVRRLFAVHTLPSDSARRWHRDAPLRRLLGKRYFPLSRALDQLRRRSVRASSAVENLNSRLRNYFFLRRHLGPDYLELLRFYLNHRRLPRSAHPERAGCSPAEVLTGQGHRHWLELLGCTRFTRN
jgi:hypothetical protein